MARNPATGAPVKVKASKKAKITALKGFKDAVMSPSAAPKLAKGVWPPAAAKAAPTKAGAAKKPAASSRATAGKSASTPAKAAPKRAATKAPAKKAGAAKRSSAAKKR